MTVIEGLAMPTILKTLLLPPWVFFNGPPQRVQSNVNLAGCFTTKKELLGMECVQFWKMEGVMKVPTRYQAYIAAIHLENWKKNKNKSELVLLEFQRDCCWRIVHSKSHFPDFDIYRKQVGSCRIMSWLPLRPYRNAQFFFMFPRRKHESALTSLSFAGEIQFESWSYKNNVFALDSSDAASEVSTKVPSQ